MKRYTIRTVTRDVGSLPVDFPYHVEDDRGAWVRCEDAEALRAGPVIVKLKESP